MIFQSIKLTNFKCYASADVAFHPSLNCIVGNNGSGKTNLLDALYYCCFTKSYFYGTDQFVYRDGSDFFRIDARLEADGEQYRAEIKAPLNGSKQIVLNGAAVARRSDYIGRFNAVMIAPDDNQIILGGSEGRRKFMDGSIGQYDAEYLRNLIRYQKLLRQRNALLKQFRKTGRMDSILLETLDERLSAGGETIYHARKTFIGEFVPLFLKAFHGVAGAGETPRVEYASQLDEDRLEDLLERHREDDKAAGRTGFGPHKDDLKCFVFDRPIKQTGSQGQQKSFLVALKLAQYELIETKRGQKPLLFLDDLRDKFDPVRTGHILSMISENRFGQVFITDTSSDRLTAILKNHNLDYSLFRIDDAQIERTDG